MLQAYQACVLPSGHFACEVWGILPLRAAARQARGALAAVRLRHLKKLVDLQHLVPTPILLAELQLSSMPDSWLLRAIVLLGASWNEL